MSRPGRSYFFSGWTRLQGGSRGGAIGAIKPLKPTKVSLFTMILYNSVNSIRDRSFCQPLFCHDSFVKYTSSLLQEWTRNDAWSPSITEIAPVTLLAGSAPVRLIKAMED